MNDLIYQSIKLIKSKTSVNIFNFLTNNNDFIYICPHLYLGNINSSHQTELLIKNNIQCIINCSNDVDFHPYFDTKIKVRIQIEDSKNLENINKFKSKIIEAVYFIDKQIMKKNNVIVHCYWGLVRSPTVIAAYLIYKYNFSVEKAIEYIREKKNFTFHVLYNFKEILYYIKKEFDLKK